jgi:succinoglycan biosynthesis transport protein ExoP
MAAIDFYRALWRRRYMIVALTAVITGIAWFLASREAKTYEATTMIRIEQTITDPTQAGSALAVGQQLAQTYAQIVTAQSIQAQIYKALGGKIPASQINISASPVQNLALLHISNTSRSPRDAALVANEAPAVLRKFIAGRQSAIKDQIITINRAEVPSSPISPRPKRTALLALLIGLVFNGGLALVIEFFSDRLPDVEEIERAVGKPVLGTIPALRFAATGRKRQAADDEVWADALPPPASNEVVVIHEVPQENRIG